MLSLLTVTMITAQPSFTTHTIDGSFNGARDVYPIDIDGDGDIDVLGAARTGNEIAWFENDGTQSFTKHSIDNSFTDVRSIHAIDIDGDGDIDVLGASGSGDEIAWWRNNGSQSFTKQSVDNSFDGAWDVQAIDIDDDGDIDILAAAFGADEISWFENNGSESFTKRVIDNAYDGAWSVYAKDVDRDGDMDVLGTANIDDEIAWWENNGSEVFTKRSIDNLYDGARGVYAEDIDNDGDIDILGAASSDQDITWWENDGSENFTNEHTIQGDFNGAVDVYAADMDGDGDIDVVGCAWIDQEVAWWENDGTQTFTKHTIISSFASPYNISVADVDNDGDIDILSVAETDDDITWFESDLTNQTLDFDGTDDYVTIGDIDAIDNVSQLTAAGWFYFDGLANNLRLISKQIGSNNSAGWSIALGSLITGDSDNIRFIHNVNGSSNGSIYTTGLGLTTGHWYHIAVVYDGTQATESDRVAIYVNGRVQVNNVDGSAVPTTLPATTENLVLGAKSDGSDNFFQGNMDEVSIWRIALSQSNIREMMHVMISDTTNLEAYYRFHVEAGTPTLGDDSGKRHTGTWSGASSGTNTTSTLSTETYPFTYSRINNVSGVWSATGTDGTNFSDGFRIYANTALTSTNLAVCGHDNAGTTTVTDDLGSSAAVNRFEQVWKVEVGGTVTDAILQFDLGTISGTAITAGTASDYVLLYRASTTGNFSDITTGNSISSTDRVSFTGISLSEGYYTIGTKDDANSPLPVEMLNFTAHKVETGVQLLWQTATEINNSHFEVEWSRDGFSFAPNGSSDSWKKIGTVQGAGTTNEAQEYGFLHTYPANGENYYRLRQVDLPAGQAGFDGKWEYTKTIQINYELSTDDAPLAIYPNPANDFITIQNGKTGDVVEIFNVNGQLVKAIQINSTIQTQSIRDLSSGLYFIKSGSSVEKLIIK